MASVLIAHDDAGVRRSLAAELDRAGIATIEAASGAAALAAIEAGPADVVVSEVRLPDMDGLDLLARVSARWPDLPLVFVASDASVSLAVQAMKAGAADFLMEPLDRDELAFVVRKALTTVERRAEQPAAVGAPSSGAILGGSLAMAEALKLLEQAAAGNATVLVRGESGTGKELVARALHARSARASGPFVKIDCAALPDTLLESELFGYEKGAFTGAVARKPGRVELANGGTLFLDEIGELGLPLQAKLLRLLQDRELERLGGTSVIRVDLRVVAATHRDLETMVERGHFRQDLFYRLNVVPLWLPPLRARRADVDVLARHFCESFAAESGKRGLTLSDGAIAVLRSQRWPGNVRQLQNFMERLVVLSEAATLGEAEVRAELSRQVRFVTQSSAAVAPAPAGEEPSVVGPLDAEVRATEKRALERALRHAEGNRSLAARMLGVSRSTFCVKLAEHDPGRHVFVVSRPGVPDRVINREISSSSTSRLRLAARSKPRKEPPSHAKSETATRIDPLSWPILTYALSGVGLTVAGVFGIATLQRKAYLDGICGPQGTTCPPGSEGELETVRAHAITAAAGLGTAVAAAAAGTVLLFTVGMNRVDARIEIAPLGIALRGRM
jgi:two-component system response regulator AtoC